MGEAERPLMFAQRAEEHERAKLWLTPNWIHDRPPPGPGEYLTTCSIDIHDDGQETVKVRQMLWDGSCWISGYWHVMAWYYSPLAWDGVRREEAVVLQDASSRI